MDKLTQTLSFMENIITSTVEKNIKKEEKKKEPKPFNDVLLDSIEKIKNSFSRFNAELNETSKLFNDIRKIKNTNSLVDENLFNANKNKKISDMDIDAQVAGITKRRYSENMVLTRTSVGVAITWLLKQLKTNNLINSNVNNKGKEETSFLDDITTGASLGLGAKFGTVIVSTIIPKVLGFLGTWVLPALAPLLAGFGIYKYFNNPRAHASYGVLGSEKGLSQDIRDAQNAPIPKRRNRELDDQNISTKEYNRLINLSKELEIQEEKRNDIIEAYSETHKYIKPVTEQELLKIDEIRKNPEDNWYNQLGEKFNKTIDGLKDNFIGLFSKIPEAGAEEKVIPTNEVLKQISSIRDQNRIDIFQLDNDISNIKKDVIILSSQFSVANSNNSSGEVKLGKTFFDRLNEYEGNGGFGLGRKTPVKIEDNLQSSWWDELKESIISPFAKQAEAMETISEISVVRNQNNIESVNEGIKVAKQLDHQYIETTNHLINVNENFKNFNKILTEWIKEFKDTSIANSSVNIFTTVKDKISSFFKNADDSGINESRNKMLYSPVIAKDLLEAHKKITGNQEGSMFSVNKNDAGSGVSLGQAQWNADRARKLLLELRKTDSNQFDSIMGQDIVSKMQREWTGKGGSNIVTFSSVDTQNFKKLMADKKMQETHNKMFDETMAGNLANAQKAGVKDPKAMLYYADLVNQYGAYGAKQFLAKGNDIDSIHSAVSSKGDYMSRRNRVYKEAKGVQFSAEKISSQDLVPKSFSAEPVDSRDKIKDNYDEINKLITSVDNLVEKLDKPENKDSGLSVGGSSVSVGNDITTVPKHILGMVFGVNIGGTSQFNFA